MLSENVDEILNQFKQLDEVQQDFAQIEYATLSNAAKKSNLGGSILFGYIFILPKISFDIELSLDFGKGKIGSNKKKEIEIHRNYSLGILARAGYSFYKNTRVYANLGWNIAQYKAYYSGLSAYDINKKSSIVNTILGAGFEASINPKLRVFYEVNYSKALSNIKTNAGDIKVNSMVNKVGFRYLF